MSTADAHGIRRRWSRKAPSGRASAALVSCSVSLAIV